MLRALLNRGNNEVHPVRNAKEKPAAKQGMELRVSLQDVSNKPLHCGTKRPASTAISKSKCGDVGHGFQKQASKQQATVPKVDSQLLAPSLPPVPSNVENIDQHDLGDPMFCTEYVSEIFDYLKDKEVSDRMDWNYMKTIQTDVNEKMRSILVDWMMEVHLKFKLLSETLFVATLIVDRYLSLRSIQRSKLQLLGITAMWVASKFEEIYAVDVGDFVFISANAYTKKEIIQFETEVLNTLKFSLSTPSPLSFLRRYSKAALSRSETHTLSKYLIELTLLDYTMLKHLPSQLAASAVYLSRRIFNLTPYWGSTLEHYTGLSESDIKPCARELHSLHKRQPEGNLKACLKKYSSIKLLEVGTRPPAKDF